MIQIVRAAERQIIVDEKQVHHVLPLERFSENHIDRSLLQVEKIDYVILHGSYYKKMHRHENDQILFYIRKGVMLYEDTSGMQVPLYKSHLMMINAGKGLSHEETIPNGNESVEMLQVFIHTQEYDLPSRVQFHTLKEIYSINCWRLIGGNEKSKAPLNIRSNVLFYDVRLLNDIIKTPPLNNRMGLLYVFDGAVELSENNINLEKGDSVVIKEEDISLKTTSHADLVFIILNEKSSSLESSF